MPHSPFPDNPKTSPGGTQAPGEQNNRLDGKWKIGIMGQVLFSVSHKPMSSKRPPADASSGASQPIKLLSGGNPQIAKADGDEPVQRYIAAMPGWKSALGKKLDAIITDQVQQVKKAVRWNSPMYGIEGQGWFVSFHVFTRYVKVTFFRGEALSPALPGKGKDANARWIDLHETDTFEEEQFAQWVRQAASLPGWIP